MGTSIRENVLEETLKNGIVKFDHMINELVVCDVEEVLENIYVLYFLKHELISLHYIALIKVASLHFSGPRNRSKFERMW